MASKLSAQELALQYGWASNFLNSIPELKKLFASAVKANWSTDMFTAKLQGTKWFKSISDSERKWLLEAGTDPASAKQDLAQAEQHVHTVLDQMGLNTATYGGNGAKYTQLINSIAYNVQAKGWTDDQIKYYAAPMMKLTNGKMSGDAEQNYSNALQYAYSMGVTMSNSWYQSQVDNIEKGVSTYDDLEAGIRAQAKSQYSQYAKQIDGGQTLADIASPYIQDMSNILEVNSATLSPFDPTIKKALTYKDPTTGAVGSQPLWQFENTLRQDPRWLQTDNARNSLMDTAKGVLTDMGMMG